jgi:hypothetical protein
LDNCNNVSASVSKYTLLVHEFERPHFHWRVNEGPWKPSTPNLPTAN